VTGLRRTRLLQLHRNTVLRCQHRRQWTQNINNLQ